jgi:thymidylate synthase (FAD)
VTDITFRSDVTVELIQSMGGDEAVVRSARVSTTSGTTGDLSLGEREKGLINFLMRDRHGTPFEHNGFTFYIEAPIFVFREFMRHRMASYNEESGRYKELEPVFYVPGDDRNLIQVGKPGAYTFEPGSYSQVKNAQALTRLSSERSYELYKKMLSEGIAREVARGVLPVNTYSSMYVTMNARSLMNFLSLRTMREGTHFPSFPQREIEMVAEKMECFFAEKMPITYETFNKNGRVAP